MMTFLSWLLVRLVGAWLARLTIPATAMAAVMGWHAYTKEHDAKLTAMATNICDARWEAGIRKEERDGAQAAARVTQSVLLGERKINDDLRSEIEKSNQELVALRQASVGTDDRCLSDGVLRAIGSDGSQSAVGRRHR